VNDFCSFHGKYKEKGSFKLSQEFKELKEMIAAQNK
jgi:hypothetical protein